MAISPLCAIAQRQFAAPRRNANVCANPQRRCAAPARSTDAQRRLDPDGNSESKESR